MLQRYDERNRDLLVNIDGRLLHRDQAGVSPFDSSVQNGDAVWEGLRLYQGRVFRLREHLARLRRSAEALGYDRIPPDDLVIERLRATLAANGMRDGVHVRLTLSRGRKYTSGLDPRLNTSGPTLIIVAEHKPPVFDKGGVRLITAHHRRPPPNVLDQRIHSCNQLTSILAKMEATRAGADDALMLDTRGFVAETSATHLFLVKAGAVATPTTVACPEGITRAVVLEICRADGIPAAEQDLLREAFYDADEVFCTGTMGEIAPVIRIDDRVIGTGAGAGPVTARIMVRFDDRTRAEGDAVAE